jgi:hypothetical protein
MVFTRYCDRPLCKFSDLNLSFRIFFLVEQKMFEHFPPLCCSSKNVGEIFEHFLFEPKKIFRNEIFRFYRILFRFYKIFFCSNLKSSNTVPTFLFELSKLHTARTFLCSITIPSLYRKTSFLGSWST